jgi:hypothetical protein
VINTLTDFLSELDLKKVATRALSLLSVDVKRKIYKSFESIDRPHSKSGLSHKNRTDKKYYLTTHSFAFSLLAPFLNNS